MRSVAWFGFVLILASAEALGCSCAGIRSIETAISDATLVVVGRVKQRTSMDFEAPNDWQPIVIEVGKVLKGQAPREIYVSHQIMCYRSFSLDHFKVGSEYVLALHPGNMPDSVDAAAKPPHQLFLLPGCSHTALALNGQGLYTNEVTSAGGRRLKYYMRLSHFEFLMSSGLLRSWRLIVFSAISAMLVLVLIQVRIGLKPKSK